MGKLEYVSVFIPVYNGSKYLKECVDSILAQELPKSHELELIVIDSGSTDDSLEILKSYGEKLKLIEIPNSEFGHGKTRQKAAETAKGKFILFLSQDASPASSRWLINMIEPFFLSEKVGCVFGRQIPRPDGAAVIKREVATVFGTLGPPDSITINRSQSLVDNEPTNNMNVFFSDVNSAARRELLITTVPFRNVTYAEDQALAEDMQNNGYLKAYSPHGAVWHSNEYTFKEYYHRKFDEYLGLRESVNLVITPSYKSLLLGWIIPSFIDYKFILRDREYGKKMKLKWLALSPLYNIALELGKFNANKYYSDEAKRKKSSLESRTRR